MKHVWSWVLTLGSVMGGCKAQAQEPPILGTPVYEESAAVEYPLSFSDTQWKERLGSGERYQVLRQKATERPWTGDLLHETCKGTYYSAATGQPLFRSEDKIDCGTGWPSFSRALDSGAVVLKKDSKFGMQRIEVLDSSSGSHLGHVFDDGPTAQEVPQGTGQRFCINSASLIFVADGDPLPALVREYQEKAQKKF